MIRRSTWILLGLFAISVAAYLIWSSGGEEPAPVEIAPAPDPLWSVESEDIIAISIEDFQAGVTLALERDEEQLWSMLSPQSGPADASRVERAVSWLASPQPRAELLQAPDLSAFQLEAPLYRIALTLRDGTAYSFNVGREAPTGGSRYVSMPGRAGVLVFSSYGLQEVLTLREDLLPTPAAEATQATATAEGGASAEPSQTPSVQATQTMQEANATATP